MTRPTSRRSFLNGILTSKFHQCPSAGQFLCLDCNWILNGLWRAAAVQLRPRRCFHGGRLYRFFCFQWVACAQHLWCACVAQRCGVGTCTRANVDHLDVVELSRRDVGGTHWIPSAAWRSACRNHGVDDRHHPRDRQSCHLGPPTTGFPRADPDSHHRLPRRQRHKQENLDRVRVDLAHTGTAPICSSHQMGYGHASHGL